MTAKDIDLEHDILAACYGRGLDLTKSASHATFKMWRESVAHWGPRSPAALGCLFALVREAWGDPRAYVRRLDSGTWAVMPSDGSAGFYGTCDTEAEGLVAALEAAPQPKVTT